MLKDAKEIKKEDLKKYNDSFEKDPVNKVAQNAKKLLTGYVRCDTI